MAIGTMLITSMSMVVILMNKRISYYIEMKKIEFVSDALRNFCLVNGRLPYPAQLMNNDSDGEEYEHPENEDYWIHNPCDKSYGVVPYKTLGLSKHMVVINEKYIEYVVNPTLCGRKNARHIPPNDPRINVDIAKRPPGKPKICIFVIRSACTFYGQEWYPNGHRVFEPMQMVLHSSISCVRGCSELFIKHKYNVPLSIGGNDVTASCDAEYKGHIRCWDIPTYLKSKTPMIKLPDDSIYTPQDISYRTYNASIRGAIGAGCMHDKYSLYHKCALGQIFMFMLDADQLDKLELDPCNRLDNVFAFALAKSKCIIQDTDQTYKIKSGPYAVLSRCDLLGYLFGHVYYTLC